MTQQTKNKINLENNGLYDFKVFAINASQYSEPGRPKLCWKFITINKYSEAGEDPEGRQQYINFFDTASNIKAPGDNFIVFKKGKTNFRTTKLGRVIKESGIEEQIRSIFGGVTIETEEQRKQLFDLMSEKVFTIRVVLNEKGFPGVFTFGHEEE